MAVNESVQDTAHNTLQVNSPVYFKRSLWEFQFVLWECSGWRPETENQG